MYFTIVDFRINDLIFEHILCTDCEYFHEIIQSLEVKNEIMKYRKINYSNFIILFQIFKNKKQFL